MGYLNGKTTYLAGPMFACADDGAGWRDEMTIKLEQFGVKVENPVKKTLQNGQTEVDEDKRTFKRLIKEKKFDDLRRIFEPIGHADLRCVDKADFLVVVYSARLPMFGTIHEVVKACEQKKPILVKIDINDVNDGIVNPWLTVITKPSCWFLTWEAMIDHLKAVDIMQEPEYNPRYWTL
jgi:nucleoside 2-deoxyribosyltransferase